MGIMAHGVLPARDLVVNKVGVTSLTSAQNSLLCPSSEMVVLGFNVLSQRIFVHHKKIWKVQKAQ